MCLSEAIFILVSSDIISDILPAVFSNGPIEVQRQFRGKFEILD